jgi:hypothetical protein
LLSENYLEALRREWGFETTVRVLNRKHGYRWSRLKVNVIMSPKGSSIDKIVTFIEDVHDEYIKNKVAKKTIESMLLSHALSKIGYIEVLLKEKVETILSDSIYEIYDINKNIEQKKAMDIITSSHGDKVESDIKVKLNEIYKGSKDVFTMFFRITTIAKNEKLIKLHCSAIKEGSYIKSIFYTIQDISSIEQDLQNIIN